MIKGYIKPNGRIETSMSFIISNDELKSYAVEDDYSNAMEKLNEILTKKFIESFPKVYTFVPERLIQEFSYNIHFDLEYGLMHLYRDANDNAGVHFCCNLEAVSIDEDKEQCTFVVSFDRNLVYQEYISIGIDPNIVKDNGLESRLLFIADDEHADYFRKIFTEDAYEVEYEDNKKDIDDRNIEEILREISDGCKQYLIDEEDEDE